MSILVLMELIPTAHRYDPQDLVVTSSPWDFVTKFGWKMGSKAMVNKAIS